MNPTEQKPNFYFLFFCLTTKARPDFDEMCFNDNADRNGWKSKWRPEIKPHLQSLSELSSVCRWNVHRNRKNAGYLLSKSINYRCIYVSKSVVKQSKTSSCVSGQNSPSRLHSITEVQCRHAITLTINKRREIIHYERSFVFCYLFCNAFHILIVTWADHRVYLSIQHGHT